MANRDDILKEYRVENGIIRSPGKFEGEPIYVPYFWDMYLIGFSDEDDGDVITFHVCSDDVTEFPELAGRDSVRLYQRDDGFVCEWPTLRL